MDPKPRPNRQLYLETLRRMTPAQRVSKAFELTEFARELLRRGLRAQFPNLVDDQLHQLYLEQLAKCHNRNY